MMTCYNLAIRELKKVKAKTFTFTLYCSDNDGKFPNVYEVDEEVKLTKKQLLYLISKKVDIPELFCDFDMQEINLDGLIQKLAFDAAFPNGVHEDDLDIEFSLWGSSKDFNAYIDEISQHITQLFNIPLTAHLLRN